MQALTNETSEGCVETCNGSLFRTVQDDNDYIINPNRVDYLQSLFMTPHRLGYWFKLIMMISTKSS